MTPAAQAAGLVLLVSALVVVAAARPAVLALPAAASPGQAGHAVAIDPGHGGSDAGAEGLGFYEAEMTWGTAQALLAQLQADGRFRPFLTKGRDETLQTAERAAAANDGGAELLLSIHGNADPGGSAAGFECYPVPPGRAQHEESLRFAGCLADAFGAAGAGLRGVGGVRYLYYEGDGGKHIYEATDTTIHSDPSFGVLEHAGCPAVLAEQCFITSAADAAAFAGEEGCKAAATLYYRAICDYFGLEPR